MFNTVEVIFRDYVPGISSSDSDIGKLLREPPVAWGDSTPGWIPFSIPLRDLLCGLLLPEAREREQRVEGGTHIPKINLHVHKQTRIKRKNSVSCGTLCNNA